MNKIITNSKRTVSVFITVFMMILSLTAIPASAATYTYNMVILNGVFSGNTAVSNTAACNIPGLPANSTMTSVNIKGTFNWSIGTPANLYLTNARVEIANNSSFNNPTAASASINKGSVNVTITFPQNTSANTTWYIRVSATASSSVQIGAITFSNGTVIFNYK